MTELDETGDLPLNQVPLLRAAVGRRLENVERALTRVESFLEFGGSRSDYLTSASGPTQFTFSGGLVHTFISWPSQLSVVILAKPLPPDDYSERHRLSPTSEHDPEWLRSCIGATVNAVRVHVFVDDVPSDEARQAAVSYVLGNGVELFYCTQLHGRMSGDELLRREDLPEVLPARTISVSDEPKKSP